MKRIISLMLSVIMVLALVPFSALSVNAKEVDYWDGTVAAFEQGSGTEDDPYLLTSAEEFAFFAQSVRSGTTYEGEYFKLTVDIVLNDFTFNPDTGLVKVTDGTNTAYLGTGIKGDTSGENTVFDTTASTGGSFYVSEDAKTTGSYGGALNSWLGIGDYNHPFSGYFDGGCHTVSGLYYIISSWNHKYWGLFGFAKNATIKNIAVENSFADIYTYYEYYSTARVNAVACVGGIAGRIISSKIENCYCATSCFSASSPDATNTNCGVGGIVGYAGTSSDAYNDTVNISNCYNGSYVYSADTCAGGIVGANDSGTINISNCYNYGSVRGYYAGGIIGEQFTSNLNMANCYNVGTVSASQRAGGILGDKSTHSGYTYSFTNCYYKLGCATYGSTIAEGFGGTTDSTSGCKSITAGNLKKQSSYSGFDFDNVWTMDIVDGYEYPTLMRMPFVDASECVHQYRTSVVEPTCTERGYTLEYCTRCVYEKETNYVSANGHNYQAVVTAPTCTEQGFTTYTCSDCGDSYVDSYVKENGHKSSGEPGCTTDETCLTCGITLNSAIGHNHTETIVPPNCDQQGYTAHVCERCGDSYKDNFVRANGHTPGAEADCENDQICTACGDVITEAYGHDYKAVVTPKTCTTKGYTTHTCEDCGDSYVDSYVPASHNPGAEADCGSDQICIDCKTVLNEAYGHTAASNKWYSNGTSHWKLCACGEKVEMTAHTPGADADCENDQICTVCNKVLKTAYGHSYKATVTPKTCTSRGYTTHTCDDCGDSYIDSYVPASHNPGTEADCENDQICIDCKTVLTTAYGHSAVSNKWYSDGTNHWKLCSCGEPVEVSSHTPGADADCVNNQVCTVCNKVLKLAGGHNSTGVWQHNETRHWQDCNCGQDLYSAAHDYQWVVTIEPKFGVPGEKIYICKTCEYINTTSVIPALDASNPDDLLGDANKNPAFTMDISVPGCYKAGEEVVVTVTINNINTAAGLQHVHGKLYFDTNALGFSEPLTDKLELKDSFQGLAEWEDMTRLCTDGNGLWWVEVDATTAGDANGNITDKITNGQLVFKIKFIALEDATGDIVVYIPHDSVTGDHYAMTSPYTHTSYVGNGSYATISEVQIGDINGNGKLDAIDYTLLKRFYFGTYSMSNSAVADVNGNDKLDAIDYTLLKRAYFGTYSIG